jgi:hypothetical protein
MKKLLIFIIFLFPFFMNAQPFDKFGVFLNTQTSRSTEVSTNRGERFLGEDLVFSGGITLLTQTDKVRANTSFGVLYEKGPSWHIHHKLGISLFKFKEDKVSFQVIPVEFMYRSNPVPNWFNLNVNVGVQWTFAFNGFDDDVKGFEIELGYSWDWMSRASVYVNNIYAPLKEYKNFYDGIFLRVQRNIYGIKTLN